MARLSDCAKFGDEIYFVSEKKIPSLLTFKVDDKVVETFTFDTEYYPLVIEDDGIYHFSKYSHEEKTLVISK